MSSFKTELRNNKIRYMILVDDWRFLEFEYRLKGRSTDWFINKINGVPRRQSRYKFLELKKLAWVNLLMARQPQEGFKRYFTAKFNVQHFYKFVRFYEFTDL